MILDSIEKNIYFLPVSITRFRVGSNSHRDFHIHFCDWITVIFLCLTEVKSISHFTSSKNWLFESAYLMNVKPVFFTVCWFFHPLTLETIPMMLAYQIGQLLKSFSIKLTKLSWLLNSMIPNIRWVLLCWMTLDIIRLFNVSYHVKEIESTMLDDKSIAPSSYSYFGHFTELFTGFLLNFYF